jgi:hypothetical protein
VLVGIFPITFKRTKAQAGGAVEARMDRYLAVDEERLTSNS